MSATVQVQKRQVIVPTGQDLSWLEARKAVKEKGGLPSHVLHDDYLVGSEKWKELPSGYYAAWAREVLVYPEQSGQFRKGIDVVDVNKDNAGREWILPASSIPEQAIGRAKVGLFIDPEQVEVNDKRVVILPKSVVVLEGFIQESGTAGKVDEKTRVPLEISKELFDNLSDSEKRWLFRISGVGVRPLIRGFDRYGIYGQGVSADRGHDNGYGVAYVGLEEAAPKIEVARAPENQGILVKGVTLEAFRAIVEDANASLSDIAQTVRPEKLEALSRLIKALEIKE
ncbi:MAG: hypothetical protein AABX38_02395 [Candidatus Micrarchaeota archaeon]